jgi:DNA invertase Pin-like site-specific DNA recombinase
MSDRFVIYARVSTDNQTHDSQLDEVRGYCKRRGWVVAEEITDVASGGKCSREGLDRLMAQVRRGRVGTVVVFRLDRLARSLSHLAQMLGEFQLHGTALVCPGQGIDTSNTNPAAQLQVNILAAVAQFERELIVERIKAGVTAAKARGVRLGRPARYDGLLPKVRSLVEQGKGAAAISRELGIPSSSAGELARKVRFSLQSLPFPLLPSSNKPFN